MKLAYAQVLGKLGESWEEGHQLCMEAECHCHLVLLNYKLSKS